MGGTGAKIDEASKQEDEKDISIKQEDEKQFNTEMQGKVGSFSSSIYLFKKVL